MSCAISYGFLAPCQDLENVNDTIQRKRLDRERKTDGTDRPYFIRTLPPTSGDPNIINRILILILFCSFISQRKIVHIATDSNVLKITLFAYFFNAYPSKLSVGHWYTYILIAFWPNLQTVATVFYCSNITFRPFSWKKNV